MKSVEDVPGGVWNEVFQYLPQSQHQILGAVNSYLFQQFTDSKSHFFFSFDDTIQPRSGGKKKQRPTKTQIKQKQQAAAEASTKLSYQIFVNRDLSFSSAKSDARQKFRDLFLQSNTNLNGLSKITLPCLKTIIKKDEAEYETANFNRSFSLGSADKGFKLSLQQMLKEYAFSTDFFFNSEFMTSFLSFQEYSSPKSSSESTSGIKSSNSNSNQAKNEEEPKKKKKRITSKAKITSSSDMLEVLKNFQHLKAISVRNCRNLILTDNIVHQQFLKIDPKLNFDYLPVTTLQYIDFSNCQQISLWGSVEPVLLNCRELKLLNLSKCSGLFLKIPTRFLKRFQNRNEKPIEQLLNQESKGKEKEEDEEIENEEEIEEETSTPSSKKRPILTGKDFVATFNFCLKNNQNLQIQHLVLNDLKPITYSDVFEMTKNYDAEMNRRKKTRNLVLGSKKTKQPESSALPEQKIFNYLKNRLKGSQENPILTISAAHLLNYDDLLLEEEEEEIAVNGGNLIITTGDSFDQKFFFNPLFNRKKVETFADYVSIALHENTNSSNFEQQSERLQKAFENLESEFSKEEIDELMDFGLKKPSILVQNFQDPV